MTSIVLPENISEIRAYQPGKPIEEVKRQLGLDRVVKLASNENAFGPSPEAVKAAVEALQQSRWYPDAAAYYLRSELAGCIGVPEDHIAFGAGSTELVLLIAEGLVTPGDHAIIADATFLMYQLALRINRIPYTEVPLTDYRYDLDGMLEALQPNTRLIYIANPNNPTGTYIDTEEMHRFLAELPDDVLVVYDEAYHHYVDRDNYPCGLDLYRSDPRVIVLRTFSKVYGLANLRIGYAVARPELLHAIEVTRSPFNTSGVAQAAARASLRDTRHIDETVRKTIGERRRIRNDLLAMGFHVLPSVTNFLCILVDIDPFSFFRSLLQRGVIVRPLPPFGLPNGIRITIGTPEDNVFCLEQIHAMLKSEVPSHG